MTLQRIEGEYLNGWRVRHDDLTQCPTLNSISQYMSGWGQLVSDSVAKALGSEMIEDGRRVITYTVDDVQRVAALIAERQAARAARKAATQMVGCSCGHTVARSLVMSASLGTSCPDCFDRMSDGE